MAAPSVIKAALLDLPLEVLTCVCQPLDVRDLVRVAESCKRFRHGDRGLETVELPTKSPVVTALRELAFPRGEPVPRSRPSGSESWVAYLARCVRQRRCREAPPLAAGSERSQFVASDGMLMACGGAGINYARRHDHANPLLSAPTPAAGIAKVRVRSVAAGPEHSIALTWDGRVYSRGNIGFGQLGHGDKCDKHSPVLMERLGGVRSVAAGDKHSLAVTPSGVYFCGRFACRGSGEGLSLGKVELRPILIEGFGRVRVRRVCAGADAAFAIGEDGELFSWGAGDWGFLGHGDGQNHLRPNCVEALQGVRVSSVAVGRCNVLALAEDGLMYAWGENHGRSLLGNPDVGRERLPKPIEALRCVRLGSIAAAGCRSYAVADTGEVWAWGLEGEHSAPLGHGEQRNCPLPKPIASLRDVKVDAVAASDYHNLALAYDGSVYAWGDEDAADSGALGLGPAVMAAMSKVPTPQRIPELRVACGL
jgi:alpha-tubulin suppressor-like RCC1 family protein